MLNYAASIEKFTRFSRPSVTIAKPRPNHCICLSVALISCHRNHGENIARKRKKNIYVEFAARVSSLLLLTHFFHFPWSRIVPLYLVVLRDCPLRAVSLKLSKQMFRSKNYCSHDRRARCGRKHPVFCNHFLSQISFTRLVSLGMTLWLMLWGFHTAYNRMLSIQKFVCRILR